MDRPSDSMKYTVSIAGHITLALDRGVQDTINAKFEIILTEIRLVIFLKILLYAHRNRRLLFKASS
jgi:hypothetical protein